MNKTKLIHQLNIIIGHLELTNEKYVIDNLPEEVFDKEEVYIIDNDGAIEILNEIIEELT